MRNKFEEDDSEFLLDLLMDTDLSISQIAREMNTSVNEVNSLIKKLGLSWIKKGKRKMSRGQSSLTQIMQKLLPGEIIVNEHHIGDRLKLDIYCPSYKLAAEYHGRQHFYYTSRFFESKYDFEESKKRDEKKVQYCLDNGIALIVFRYNDALNEDTVYNRLLEAIRNTDHVTDQKKNKSVTANPKYKEAKKKHSEYRKALYRKMKDAKLNDNRRHS